MSFIYNYLVSNENTKQNEDVVGLKQHLHPQQATLENHSPCHSGDLLSIYTPSGDEISPTRSRSFSSVSGSEIATNVIDDDTDFTDYNGAKANTVIANLDSDSNIKVDDSYYVDADIDEPGVDEPQEREEWTCEGPFTVSSGLPSLNANNVKLVEEKPVYSNQSHTSSSSNNSEDPLLRSSAQRSKASEAQRSVASPCNENVTTEKRTRSLSPIRSRHLSFGPTVCFNTQTNGGARQRNVRQGGHIRARSFPTCRSDQPKVREVPTICDRFREICRQLKQEIVETWEFALEELSRIFPCFSSCSRSTQPQR